MGKSYGIKKRIREWGSLEIIWNGINGGNFNPISVINNGIEEND